MCHGVPSSPLYACMELCGMDRWTLFSSTSCFFIYYSIWVKPWMRPVVVGRPFWMRTGKYGKRQEKGNKRWAKQPSSVGFLMSQQANFAISISLSSDRPSSMKSNGKEQRMQVSRSSKIQSKGSPSIGGLFMRVATWRQGSWQELASNCSHEMLEFI